ncbi:PAS domain S-box protein [Desulfobacter latus]|uniref:histidine kinase n=1 Tax=Desulfobacter latus TaxID=2292 RepID=A0A850SUZ3_9BACT|nr:PAS domain S-box protein [Desulfobacter latus]
MKNTDVHDVLGKFSPDTLLFRLNNLLNAEEHFVSIHETMAILSKEVALPIFTAWDFDMGLGAIGGVLVSAMEQGRKAAALSIQILEGTSADDIPIIMESPNIPFIDYQQIRRFGLTLKDLPEGVHLMNRPDTLWGKYKHLISFVLCSLFSLMIIVVLQTVHLKKRYKIEKTLKASKEEIKSIFRTAPVGIGFVVNRVLKKVNNRMCEICGYDESELIGRSARILYPDDAAFEFVGRKKYDQITKHGIGKVETRWQRKDGSIVDVILSSTFVDVADHAKGVTFTALDITDHKQTKNDLESQQKFLTAVFDNIEEGIVICDENGTLVQFNEAARKLHGLPEQPVKPQQWSEYYSLFKADGITPLPVEEIPLYRALTGEHVRDAEIVVATGDSSLRHLVCNGQRLKNNAGKIIGAVVAMHDDTQRRMAELKRKKLQTQLNQARKMESIGTLAGGIAHEFNNILSIIIGNNELIMEDLPEKSLARENSEEIRLASLRARDIVRHLLTFSRHDASSKKPIEIGSVVRESLKLIRSTTPTNIEIRDKISPDCLPIYGDATQINQILINLCNNAVDALQISGGTIDIELCNTNLEENEAFLIPTSASGTYVKLAVRDNGIGMDKKILEKIFEPYFTTKGVGEGSGLGLAVVHGIVKKHGGSIVCDSKKNQGSVFTILIPAYDEPSIAKE